MERYTYAWVAAAVIFIAAAPTAAHAFGTFTPSSTTSWTEQGSGAWLGTILWDTDPKCPLTPGWGYSFGLTGAGGTFWTTPTSTTQTVQQLYREYLAFPVANQDFNALRIACLEEAGGGLWRWPETQGLMEIGFPIFHTANVETGTVYNTFVFPLQPGNEIVTLDGTPNNVFGRERYDLPQTQTANVCNVTVSGYGSGGDAGVLVAVDTPDSHATGTATIPSGTFFDEHVVTLDDCVQVNAPETVYVKVQRTSGTLKLEATNDIQSPFVSYNNGAGDFNNLMFILKAGGGGFIPNDFTILNLSQVFATGTTQFFDAFGETGICEHLTATTTVLGVPIVYPTGGGVADCTADLARWLFVPDEATLSSFGNSWQQAREKVPWGYFYLVADEFSDFGEESTTTTIFSVQVMGTTTTLFDPTAVAGTEVIQQLGGYVRSGMSLAMWGAFIFWIWSLATGSKVAEDEDV